jgi:hypothetical protein
MGKKVINVRRGIPARLLMKTAPSKKAYLLLIKRYPTRNTTPTRMDRA